MSFDFLPTFDTQDAPIVPTVPTHSPAPIEIDKGWSAASVQTLADCDEAYEFLVGAIAQIELQIDLEVAEPARGAVWLARARCALKYKQAAREIVSNKRKALESSVMTALREIANLFNTDDDSPLDDATRAVRIAEKALESVQ